MKDVHNSWYVSRMRKLLCVVYPLYYAGFFIVLFFHLFVFFCFLFCFVLGEVLFYGGHTIGYRYTAADITRNWILNALRQEENFKLKYLDRLGNHKTHPTPRLYGRALWRKDTARCLYIISHRILVTCIYPYTSGWLYWHEDNHIISILSVYCNRTILHKYITVNCRCI